MAFAALISLRSTMQCFANFTRHLAIPTFTETKNLISKEMKFLKEAIDELDDSRKSKRVIKALERQIQEALHQFEDILDSVRANMILISQSDQGIANERRSVYVEEVKQGINSFVKMVKKIKKKYCKVFEEDNDDDDDQEDDDDDDDDDDNDNEDEVEEEEEDDDDNDELVGVSSDQLTKIKKQLTEGYKSYELGVVSFVGLAGTGRSKFAKILFDDANDNPDATVPLFKLRAWVSVGPIYEFKEILASILSQIQDHPGNNHKFVDEEIFEYVSTRLKSGRYLIVLDDVRETGVWEYLKEFFPDENNGSRVLLTTHLNEVALSADSLSTYPMLTLKKEESWNLLSTILFPKRKLCPPEFEKAGKKIVESCRGLHVEVAKAAILLSKGGKKPEHWEKVAAEMEKSSAKDAYDEILEISKIKEDNILPKGGSAKILEKVLDLPYSVTRVARNDEFPNDLYPNLKVVALVGMAGIGKTALARNIFKDPWTLGCYEHRVWLTFGPKHQLKRILADFLAQLDPNNEYDHVKSPMDVIRSILSAGKRCLIVLDDVWEDRVWRQMKKILGDIKCEILLTTRLQKITSEFFGYYFGSDREHNIPLLNKEESWNLLCKRVFGKELCPRELEKVGKIIAEDCDGLPLTIVTVARLLSKADEKTPKYWNEVATKKNSVFEDAYRRISTVLYPSYKNLRLEYRTCFLYMAAFRIKYEIPITKLFMLCTAEGLLHSTPWTLAKEFTSMYLVDLAFESLILINDKYNDKAKTCRLHSVFWHFCAREARNDKFLNVVNRYADGVADDIKDQRRLCIQNNVLFAIKDVYNSMETVSTARSLLCFGPPHQYQVPLCTDHLKLLKVLDTLAVRFYEFPVGIFKLVLLRYLALTYDGKFPDSVSNLWNLEFLNLQQHMSIRSPGDSSYLPMEIWDMKELKHLQIMGRNLPEDPRKSRARLDKLLTLSDVRAETCKKSILERIPNLAKFGIRIELEPNAFESTFSFDCISHLKRLKSLKCVVVNPELKSVIAALPAMLPPLINKLSLSGLGYSWEHVRSIASLPYLLVLKLRCYAFRGAEWVMHEGDFSSLQYLLLEDTDLVHWRADGYCRLSSLQLLIISHCFKLKEIPWHCLPESCEVELVDCNPSALERMPENFSARVNSSWELRKFSA